MGFEATMMQGMPRTLEHHLTVAILISIGDHHIYMGRDLTEGQHGWQFNGPLPYANTNVERYNDYKSPK